jgi:hypothetical protein
VLGVLGCLRARLDRRLGSLRLGRLGFVLGRFVVLEQVAGGGFGDDGVAGVAWGDRGSR